MNNRAAKLVQSYTRKLEVAARRDARAMLSEGVNLESVAYFLTRVSMATKHVSVGAQRVLEGQKEAEGVWASPRD